MIWWEKFWSKVDIGDCWSRLGGKNSKGYAVFTLSNGRWYAHRFIWEQLVGPIPEGQTIDHLCRNKPCVNPDHMEVVSPVVNWRRSPHVNARKQFCKNGHPLVRLGNGRRGCPKCNYAQHRRYLKSRVMS